MAAEASGSPQEKVSTLLAQLPIMTLMSTRGGAQRGQKVRHQRGEGHSGAVVGAEGIDARAGQTDPQQAGSIRRARAIRVDHYPHTVYDYRAKARVLEDAPWFRRAEQAEWRGIACPSMVVERASLAAVGHVATPPHLYVVDVNWRRGNQIDNQVDRASAIRLKPDARYPRSAAGYRRPTELAYAEIELLTPCAAAAGTIAHGERANNLQRTQLIAAKLRHVGADSGNSYRMRVADRAQRRNDRSAVAGCDRAVGLDRVVNGACDQTPQRAIGLAGA